ncbi:endogenous retrovirus group K3 member 1 isoform X4 [Strix uralensis]|uniref:endogenous retrovirus group K3 member 1 isoform X4 n=1 Tax=Strix uralensis TaxID=36305 RepID=UPI003DA4FE74
MRQHYGTLCCECEKQQVGTAPSERMETGGGARGLAPQQMPGPLGAIPKYSTARPKDSPAPSNKAGLDLLITTELILKEPDVTYLASTRVYAPLPLGMVLGGYRQEQSSHIMRWKDQPFNPIPQISQLTMQESTCRLCSPRNSVTAAITWGSLKQPQPKAEDMMTWVGAMPTPENTFLAYLALISTSSACSRLRTQVFGIVRNSLGSPL